MAEAAPLAASSHPERPRRRAVVRSIALFALSIACAWIIVELVGSIDWDQVKTALRHVNAWQVLVLVLLLVVRQVLNASPLALFLEELSIFRATASDQAATLTSMVAPPPSDLVLRLAVLRTWGIESSRGLAATTLNVLVFYVNRLMMPLLGFVILLTLQRFDSTSGITALVATPVGLVLLGLTLLAMRNAALAGRVGELAGRLVSKVKKSVDPESWRAATLEFRNHIADRFWWVLPRALVLLAVMVVVDAVILLLSLRFVGVDSEALPAVEVICAFLVMFPLTLFPLQGLGIMDAALLAICTNIAGLEAEPEIVAALMVYRIITLGTPMLLGVVALAYWRHSARADSPVSD